VYDTCDILDPIACWSQARICWFMEESTVGPPSRKLNMETKDRTSDGSCAPFGGPNGDLECHVVCD
jgi:hypothetical protein